MSKYKVIWYDNDNTIEDTSIIEADSYDDAVNKAYSIHNGNPPAKCLLLEEVK